jgi:hypothetical protein
MQLMLGVLKKKLKHDLNHAVEELDLPQATTASRILKDRSPDVTLLREASASCAERFEKEKYCFTRTTHQKWSGTAQKTGIEADVINAINSISLHILGLLRPSSCLRRGFFICATAPAAWRWRVSTRPTARETNGRWLGSLRPLVTRCGREAPFRSRQRRFRWCEYALHGRGRTRRSCRRRSFRFSRTR